MMRVAVCAIFRNEGRYLREWIEFHRLAGVERFYLYQHMSDDEWEAVLQPYVDAGLVHVTEWNKEPPCQTQAYQHCIAMHKYEPGWIAFLDCDEFLFSPTYPSIGKAIEAIAQPEWGAIGVNWMCFGGSSEEEYKPEPVIERFTLRPADSFPPNCHIKTLARFDRVQMAGRNSHEFVVQGGTWDETGRAIEGPLTARPAHALLRIHHYHTKSRGEYALRHSWGYADGGQQRPLEEYEGYQAQDVADRSAWRFLPELKRRLAKLPLVASVKPLVPDMQQAPEVSDAPKAKTPYSPYAEHSPSRTPSRDFAGFQNFHQGETMLVCGCGSSLPSVVAPERFPVIGVNDVGRLLDPDYLLVINPRNQFSSDRFEYVANSRARVVFTQLELGLSHPHVVRFNLGRRGGTSATDGRSLPYTRNSPYVALCLALHMGAKRIGLIGVDFTDHHFFAATGRHPLLGELNQINQEYATLAQACKQRGVEVFNLSADSRLTAFPKISPEDFARSSLVPTASTLTGRKAFFVNYKFLSCGEVFTDGLRNAAQDLGMETADAVWDDPSLASKVEEFSPELLFVVHGRKYSQRWHKSLHTGRRSAIWLLDEPYEVDDTARFSSNFDATFVNDSSTIARHPNAHFLPVCYNPAIYTYRPGLREHRVGFIGGANPARETMLTDLARRGLLSYTVGGPWRSPELRRITTSLNIPAEETAKLYQSTQIVVNVFRTAHHFNRGRIEAVSMNPRVYEALACGALVISERRPEIEQLCPEMPVFDGPEELAATIESLLADPARFSAVRKACIRRLAGHTYAHRLYTAFTTAMDMQAAPWVASSTVVAPAALTRHVPAIAVGYLATPARPVEPPRLRVPVKFPGWEVNSRVVEADGGTFLLRAPGRPTPGCESGFIGKESFTAIRLTFDLWVEPDATFIAKIHQAEQHNQHSNSYHVMVSGGETYVARHGHIFANTSTGVRRWQRMSFIHGEGVLGFEVDGVFRCLVRDALLPSGYSFLGIKAGSAKLREIQETVLTAEEITSLHESAAAQPEPRVQQVLDFEIVYDSGMGGQSEANHPQISIVTTVYDRIRCLDACLRSVQELSFDGYEHIIVADRSNPQILDQITALVRSSFDGRHRLRLAVLKSRANNWGISPAAVGLSLSQGEYVCFLSDDNGYRPDHFESLLAAFREDPALGFVYSSCLYDGRLTLSANPPAFARIDLGQPLFKREIFDRHLGGGIPFTDRAWDWQMIERFMKNGVKYRHVTRATFIFRLARYPHFAPAARHHPAAEETALTAG